MSVAMRTRRIIILGSTGSIGTQTLDVIAHLNALADRGETATRFQVVGLAAGANRELVIEQALKFGCREVSIAKPAAHAAGSPSRVDGPHGAIAIREGADAAESMVRDIDCDIVLAAMVGSAGLPATLAAVQLGRDVALANKETLVAAGEIVVNAARKSGARLLPVDSEHSGLWQCLLEEGMRGRGIKRSSGSAAATRAGSEGVCPPMDCSRAVSRVVLTASGGPFRRMSLAECYHASPAQALKHPTWTMGAKVTIDSASLTNKAFEIIEAHWLFGLPADRIGAVIHPQSIVHAMVEYADGAVVAQLGTPSMCTPIQLALTFPERPPGISGKLDLLALSNLEFQPADPVRFPALALAYRVIRDGGALGAAFNAASEEAVAAFLARKIPFGRLSDLAREAMDALGSASVTSLSDVMSVDRAAREFVRGSIDAIDAPVSVRVNATAARNRP